MPVKKQEPKCVEVSVQWSTGGKVAIQSYGNVTSNYGASLSRRYALPDGMTDKEIDSFQVAKRQELQDLLEPVDQAAFDERFAQRDF